MKQKHLQLKIFRRNHKFLLVDAEQHGPAPPI